VLTLKVVGGAIWCGGWRKVGDEVTITVVGEAGARSRQVEAAEDSRMVGMTFRAARDPEVAFALNGEGVGSKVVEGGRGNAWMDRRPWMVSSCRHVEGRRTSEEDTFEEAAAPDTPYPERRRVQGLEGSRQEKRVVLRTRSWRRWRRPLSPFPS